MVMDMPRKYNKQPHKDTCLKSHEALGANFFVITMAVEVTRTVKVKALNQNQAVFFAKNRIRKKSKTLAVCLKGNVGDIHTIAVREMHD